MSLTAKMCVPCQGGILPLTRVESEHFLKEVPDWVLSEDGIWIERQFSFEDFARAQAFVNQVGDLAEEEGHHPDITLGCAANGFPSIPNWPSLPLPHPTTCPPRV